MSDRERGGNSPISSVAGDLTKILVSGIVLGLVLFAIYLGLGVLGI